MLGVKQVKGVELARCEISGALARTCGTNGGALGVELALGVDLARTCEAS